MVSKVPEGLNVAILPEEMPGLLPTMHLSDHASNCQLLWDALQEGDIISDAVCLSKTKQNVVSFHTPYSRLSVFSVVSRFHCIPVLMCHYSLSMVTSLRW